MTQINALQKLAETRKKTINRTFRLDVDAIQILDHLAIQYSKAIPFKVSKAKILELLIFRAANKSLKDLLED